MTENENMLQKLKYEMVPESFLEKSGILPTPRKPTKFQIKR